MMRALLTVLALGLLAGCLQAADRPSSTSATYRLIETTVDFTAQPDGAAGVCGFPSPPDVDRANRTLTFHGVGPDPGFRVLFLTITWDRTHCGTAASSFATSDAWNGVIASDNVTLYEMRDDGALLVRGHVLEPGGAWAYQDSGVFPDGRAWTTVTTVRDLGEWPITGVTVQR